jgi:hypothetical protein
MRKHLTYANVMATLAVVLALGGGAAYAANTVFSSDIVNGEVKSPDISDANGVRSADVVDDTLTGGGLAAADLRQASVGSSEVANNGVKGVDVNERTLSGLDANDNFDFVCDPESTDYLDCDAPATVTLDRPMNVLVIATTHFSPFGGNPAWGNCRMETNGVVDSTEHPIGGEAENAQQGGMNLVDVQSLPAGTYTFDVSCNQVEGDIGYHNIRVAAVELSLD